MTAVIRPNDDAACLIVEYESLQLAVEQHEYVVPVPITVELVGHVDEIAHEYVVDTNTLAAYVEAVF